MITKRERDASGRGEKLPEVAVILAYAKATLNNKIITWVMTKSTITNSNRYC